MSTYTQHIGHVFSIPSQASPGLLFLAAYLPTIDSLGPANPPLDHFLAPSATFTTNKDAPVTLRDLQQMFNMRRQMLSHFSHTDFPIRAWDLEGRAGKHTVIYESVSRSVLRDDIRQQANEVHELNIVELEPAENGQGMHGLWVVSSKCYMDLSSFGGQE